jgi:PAS domain S-box-containing protein
MGYCRHILSGILILTSFSLSARAESPKQVLLLHSFGREFAPFITFSETLRSELGQELGDRVEFHDVALESARYESVNSEGPLVDYLTAQFSSRRLDLVVTIGGPAAHFAQKYRPRFFPSSPLLIGCVDERLVQRAKLGTNDVVVAVKHDAAKVLEGILLVLPRTTNVAVVIGDSPLERFWADEIRHQVQPFSNHLKMTWLNKLSFAEIQERVADLPPRSAIAYFMYSVDAEGVPYTEQRALRRLHEVAHSPLFGIHDTQIGLGIVGGPLLAVEELSRNTAKVATRILQGEQMGGIQIQAQVIGRPIYDWRELKRWSISETRLPADSIVRFREATLWESYKDRIIAVISLCLVEAALIALLTSNLMSRRRVQKALRESEERFRLLVEQAPEALFVYDCEHDKVLQTNAQAERLFGCSRHELLESGPHRFYTTGQPDGASNGQTFRACAQRALQGENLVLERTIRNAEGLRLNCEVRLTRLPAGERMLVRSSFIDITERKQSEVRVRELADRYNTITTTTTDGFWELDRTGKIIALNDRACELYGYPREELLNKTIYNFEAIERAAETQARLERIIKAGHGRFETRHHCRDGRLIDLEVSTTYRTSSHTFLAFLRDLTERKRVEAEVRGQREELAHVARVTAMGELATSVAHELNQPLGAILSNAEAAELFLKQEPPALEDVRAILADIRKDDERAGEVIRRMRTLLRKHELERELVDLNSLTQDVVRLVSADAALRSTSIGADLWPHLPSVEGDRIHLQQVLLNLLINAMEAMAKQPPQKRRLVVRTGRTGNGSVELSVTDSGPGIEAANLERLFEPFFTTKESGIGMGLSIARRIIEAHHGRIWAENQPAGGAIFRVYLPVSRNEAHPTGGL